MKKVNLNGKRYDVVHEEIRSDSYRVVSRDNFHAHLVTQEVSMWRRLGEVTQEDFDFIVKRRGFNKDEMDSLHCGIKAVGLEIVND